MLPELILILVLILIVANKYTDVFSWKEVLIMSIIWIIVYMSTAWYYKKHIAKQKPSKKKEIF